MREYFLILLLGLVVCQCKPTRNKEKTYYFYNAKELFESTILKNDSLYYLHYTKVIVVPPPNKFSLSGGPQVFGLNHYYKFSGYKDTFFIKPKSYLDSIDYYGTEWFKKKENLDGFWRTSHGWFDSLKIYAIEPISGKDSLIFRRVHRYFTMFGE
jgi:hypothetical protein